MFGYLAKIFLDNQTKHSVIEVKKFTLITEQNARLLRYIECSVIKVFGYQVVRLSWCSVIKVLGYQGVRLLKWAICHFDNQTFVNRDTTV